VSRTDLLDNHAVEDAATHKNSGLWVLLWASWACAAWFVTAVILHKFAWSLPPWLNFAIVLSGAIAILGGVLAALYLMSSMWLATRWRLGVVALLVNVALAWLFIASLPG